MKKAYSPTLPDPSGGACPELVFAYAVTWPTADAWHAATMPVQLTGRDELACGLSGYWRRVMVEASSPLARPYERRPDCPSCVALVGPFRSRAALARGAFVLP